MRVARRCTDGRSAAPVVAAVRARYGLQPGSARSYGPRARGAPRCPDRSRVDATGHDQAPGLAAKRRPPPPSLGVLADFNFWADAGFGRWPRRLRTPRPLGHVAPCGLPGRSTPGLRANSSSTDPSLIGRGMGFTSAGTQVRLSSRSPASPHATRGRACSSLSRWRYVGSGHPCQSTRRRGARTRR